MGLGAVVAAGGWLAGVVPSSGLRPQPAIAKLATRSAVARNRMGRMLLIPFVDSGMMMEPYAVIIS